ncbi:TlpA family protein disulfide reductase [Marinoscillum pacificum]|uniref:TlpA family protein disulfide reductase n=1 Tax=Marinoscillum pacificum TaxID=392723 RepID=UPI0021575F50|nr:TlpA disulfide reductase family protein [Marinoscillum pacificum]
MKNTFALLTLSLVFLYSCIPSGDSAEVTIINGQFLGDFPDSIAYTVPIDGACSFKFSEYVPIDPSGSFQVNVTIQKPAFIKIFSRGVGGTVIAEPGKTYDVKLIKDAELDFIVQEPYSSVHEAYENLAPPSHIQRAASKFDGDTTVELVAKAIEDSRIKELAVFLELKENGDISEDVYSLIELDRNVFYSSIKATKSLLKFYENSGSEDDLFTTGWKQMWQDVWQEQNPNQSDLKSSSWYYDLVDNYVEYKTYESYNFDLSKFREDQIRDSVHTQVVRKSTEYLNNGALEFYQAAYLYYAAIHVDYEKELIGLYQNFISQYPTSEYTKHVEPLISPVIAYHEKLAQPMGDGIAFVDDFENINSLNELISHFAGQKVYVDVWATWCGPCKEEFNHKKELSALLSKYGIESLYISIDTPSKERQWKEMIKFYELKGKHIRTNEALSKDVRDLFDDGGSIIIPWYLLFDEEGHLVKKFASRPSELDSLENEIVVM